MEVNALFDDRGVPGKVDVDSLETKEDILGAYPELMYVPHEVHLIGYIGSYTLSVVNGTSRDRLSDGDPKLCAYCLLMACAAGLDEICIRKICAYIPGQDLAKVMDQAAKHAAQGGHVDVLELLVREFGATVDLNTLFRVSVTAQLAMFDHLVERYGLDPNAVVGDRAETALSWALIGGRVPMIKHIIEVHKGDIHGKMDSNSPYGAYPVACIAGVGA